MEVPRLIVELAIMLSAAAVVTLTFRKLKIPAILGYIVVGFLIGPNFPFFINVQSDAAIQTWSEIGVIIILFHIGLEFDFNKLADIGSTAFISAGVKMGGVLFVGYAFGRMTGMSTMNCVFLGVMLSISSTVVIQKCFEELGLSEKKFSKIVMGSLVMEDVIAVFMMVILTTMAASQSGSAADTALHLFLMLCYLIIWLLLGIFIVPTALDKTMTLMSSETLTLLSIGFCFLMALLANSLGFSMELGAFLAGSFFAGTVHVHHIERVTRGIKDMFGAVFFLSVGMMVDPAIITSRWTSIVPIAILAVVAKQIFATIGVLLSGQDVDTAIRAGMSLAPIGEFSFIIAGLGISLGVMDEYLYPVIVAASIITIMMTPVLINQTDRLVNFVRRVIPERIWRRISSYTSEVQATRVRTSEWKLVIRDYVKSFVIYGSIMMVALLLGTNIIYYEAYKAAGTTAACFAGTAFIYLIVILFARPFLGKKNAAFTKLWMERKANRTPLAAMTMIKIATLVMVVLVPLIVLFEIRNPMLLLVVPLVLYLIARFDFIASYYLQIEARFLANLNQKTMEERGGARAPQHWLDEDYNITSWHVPNGAAYDGKQIKDLSWGRNLNVYVVKLRRGDKNITMPSSNTQIREGDKVYVIGDKQSLESFLQTIETENLKPIRTLREFLAQGYPDKEHELACTAITVRGSESYVGKAIRRSGIHAGNHCMILGIERDGYATLMPDANMIIDEGDILWLIGTNDDLCRLAAHSEGIDGCEESFSTETEAQPVMSGGIS